MIKHIMGNLDYHKCDAYQPGWQSLFNKKNRIEYVKYMLKRYPKPEDWDCVRFNNKVHLKWGPQHQLRIMQKLRE